MTKKITKQDLKKALRNLGIFIMLSFCVALFLDSILDRGIILTPYVRPPVKDHTNARKVIKLLEENSPKEGLKVLEMFRIHYISEGAGELVYIRAFTPFKKKIKRWDIIDDLPVTDPNRPDSYRWSILAEALINDDFILAKTGKVIDERPDKGQMRVMFEAYKILDKLLAMPNPSYKLLAKVPIAYDNSSFLIYKKTKPLSTEEVFMLINEAIRLWPEDRVRYLNDLQSFLIEKMFQAHPDLPQQLLNYTYQARNCRDNSLIKLWSKKELEGMLGKIDCEEKTAILRYAK